jgi:hypothetical protein
VISKRLKGSQAASVEMTAKAAFPNGRHIRPRNYASLGA